MKASSQKLVEFMHANERTHMVARDALRLMRIMGEGWYTHRQLEMICRKIINTQRLTRRLSRQNRKLQRAG